MPKYAELPAFREQNYITGADGNMLHREARTLALRRIEESARTEADFENVLYWWDKLDENRERRERGHEIGRSTVPLEWGADEFYICSITCSCVTIPPRNMRKVSDSQTGISEAFGKLR